MSRYLLFIIVPLVIAAPLHGQLGTVAIPVGAQIDIPVGATLCADTIFANNPGFGTLTYPNINNICRAVIIPVDVIALRAAYHGGVIALQWKTLSERNCAGYEVQRTEQSAAWEPLAFVPVSGGIREEKSYSYVDRLPEELPRNGSLRYRLRIIDNDGSAENSPIVEVRLPGLPASPELRAAWPNPAADRLYISFLLPAETTVRLAIYNLAGEEMMALRNGEAMPSGSHVLTADIGRLQCGAYLLELATDEMRKTLIVFVER